MNQKAEKPVLSGQRIKTRKRDEKEKYDPIGFRDSIVQGFKEAGSDLEQISSYLQGDGAKLDYRRYAETLFDILFAGGILAPGGSVEEDSGKTYRTELCVFSASEEQQPLFCEVFARLFRRFIYLEHPFREELCKILKFLKGYQVEERERLAKMLALFIVQGLAPAKVLSSLFEDHLTKDNISLDFVTIVFRQWLDMRDATSIKTVLRKCQLDSRIMEFMPATRRTEEHFQNHFKQAGLMCICEIQKNQQSRDQRKEMLNNLDEMIERKENIKEIALFVREHIAKETISENEAVVIVFNRVMKGVEWNKKEDLLSEQALRHLGTFAPLLAMLASTGRSQLALLVRIQEYCYDNSSFMKIFQKIIFKLYQADVLSEAAILKWHADAHSPKGKSLFLDQSRKFVEWLKNAEEESDEEEEGDEDEEN